MAKNPQPVSVKDAVYTIQLSLLQGIANENQLFAAGSIISRSDYNDVVTERSIANLCGYPLCPKPLPSDRSRKGHYRISLKEHKVYDLQETYMYCSEECVISSGVFGRSLNEERCSVLDAAKINAVLGLFWGSGSEAEVGLGENGDLGLSKLRIEEKAETHVGEVSLEEWVGPSNAIEGYVPQRDRNSKPLGSKKSKQGSKANNSPIINDMDFVSTLIMEDEYTVSKTPTSSEHTRYTKLRGPEEIMSGNGIENQFRLLEISCNDLDRKSKESQGESREIFTIDELGVGEVPSTSSSSQRCSHLNFDIAEQESRIDKTEKLTDATLKSSLKPSRKKKLSRSVTWADEKADGVGGRNLCEVREIEEMKQAPFELGKTNKVSLKPSGGIEAGNSVSWMDEMGDSSRSIDACEDIEMVDVKEASGILCSKETGEDDEMLQFASAEACVKALKEASEAVTFGEFEASDAMSEAGIIILPQPEGVDGVEPVEDDDDTSEPEQAPLKWPKKPGSQHFDVFNPEDSWFDAPPAGFSLTLSPFAKMWSALFTWTTSSTLAYIYGRNESLHEEYLSVNGREYPRKIVLGDGRSSEIKQTLASSLARALPGLVADLRLPTPISSLEQGMGCLLDTMSFVDALPPFRMKQWQVVVLLFIEALSVYRLPALTLHMTNRRMLFHKVLDGAQISAEEYEIMKDLMIPLGRTPHFSAQSGA
ncbi:RNA polymerase II subunit B1 CTD phosphatase RPAP2-like protein [Parasponia andersonii]|uniref:RNA polymerase II subunit B1 CTD phosphatase RPAP2 homolog n=1 Tax=Parasponia andersonii TaxID=3476 RepID=A0A2P5D8H1_PARAD|nr:RNA polymerase II subunit B1 CTD phosphatase RPAP2-like protein [Parasponia andersonii]